MLLSHVWNTWRLSLSADQGRSMLEYKGQKEKGREKFHGWSVVLHLLIQRRLLPRQTGRVRCTFLPSYAHPLKMKILGPVWGSEKPQGSFRVQTKSSYACYFKQQRSAVWRTVRSLLEEHVNVLAEASSTSWFGEIWLYVLADNAEKGDAVFKAWDHKCLCRELCLQCDQ